MEKNVQLKDAELYLKDIDGIALRSKKLSALLRGIIYKHHGDFYCQNFLHLIELHKTVSGNKDFYNVFMPSKDTKVLELTWYRKTDKKLFIIYADLECIIEKIDRCKSNPENSSTTKLINLLPFDFLMSTIS